MRKWIIAFTGLAVIALGVYIFAVGGKTGQTTGETTAQVESPQQIKQLVQDIDSGKVQAQSASITAKVLTVTDENDAKTSYELPKDEFFVAIAPYVKETHPCATHNLAGCQGEMAGQSFNVRIEDQEGNVVKNEEMKAGNNGFINLWLPRDKTYHVTIEHDGTTAESDLSTSDDSNTCVTTMKLA